MGKGAYVMGLLDMYSYSYISF